MQKINSQINLKESRQIQLVTVVIPIYKEIMTADEYTSLKQCVSILNKYPITLICSDSLNLNNYFAVYGDFKVETFDDVFFKSICGYNQLLMSKLFYERFLNYEFILIYQLDAFVFHDKLEYWCKSNLDYIGAPWGYMKNGNLIITGIGNGGFSLRNTQKLLDYLNLKTIKINLSGYYRLYSGYSFIKKILRFPKILFSQTGYRNNVQFYTNGGINEDYFFGYISQYSKIKLKIPSERIALQFSFDENADILFKMNNYKLPFGCHGWNKNIKTRDFWKQFIN